MANQQKVWVALAVFLCCGALIGSYQRQLQPLLSFDTTWTTTKVSSINDTHGDGQVTIGASKLGNSNENGRNTSSISVEQQQEKHASIVLDDSSCNIIIERAWIPADVTSMHMTTTRCHKATETLAEIASIPRMEQAADFVLCILNNGGNNDTASYESVQCLQKILSDPEISATVVIGGSGASVYSWIRSLTAVTSHYPNLLVVQLEEQRGKAMNETRTTAFERNVEFNLSNSTTVLYVPCKQSTSTVSTSTTVLASTIPAYTKEIQVLVEECQDKDIIMMTRSNTAANVTLRDFLVKLHPMAMVKPVMVCNGTARNCYQYMVDAAVPQFLICLDSLACIIPAFLVTATRNAATILAGPDHYPWLSKIRCENVKVLSSSISSIQHLSCPRGRLGAWKYEPVVFKNASKFTPVDYYDKRWVRAEKADIRDLHRHKQFLWDDDLCDNSRKQLMSRDTFCSAMKTLGYKRLFALGDSLQYMAMISLSHLLGLNRIKVHRHLDDKQNSGTVQTLTCSDGYEIEFAFYRSNHLWPIYGAVANDSRNSNFTSSEEASASVQAARVTSSQARIAREYHLRHDKKPIEYFACNGNIKTWYPDEKGNCRWVYDYLNNTAPTILWAGIGSHLHYLHIFQEGLDNFEKLFLRRYERPNDLVLFRTLHPGHSACGNEIDPYLSFQEYLSRGQTTKFDWNKFVKYNQVMEERAWRISRDVTWKGAAVDIHDIYWMTALRKDGHPSNNDCLHYLLPGPPDWWSHTFSSKLLDLVADTKRHQLSKETAATVPVMATQLPI